MTVRNTNRITVTLDANGGVFRNVPENASANEKKDQIRFVTEDEVFKCFLFDLMPENDNLVLCGLNTEPEGTGKMYCRRDADYGIPLHDDITLYAIWSEAYTLHLDYSGGHHRQFPEITSRTFRIAKKMIGSDSTWYYTSDIDEPVNQDVHQGFAGWYIDGGKDDRRLYPSAVVYEEDMNMHALWKDAYALTFHAGNGSFAIGGGTRDEVYSCVKGEWLSTLLEAVNEDPERSLQGYSLSENGPAVLTKNNYLELRPVSDMEYWAVYGTEAAPAESVIFRLDELYLNLDEAYDLTEFYLMPEDARIYTKDLASDNENVVKIGRTGQLIAEGVGECNITVTINRRVKASLPVKVFPDNETAPRKVYHLYTKGSHDHLITAKKKERTALENLGWVYDSVAFCVLPKGDMEIRRFYSRESAIHRFTVDPSETERMINRGWVPEGVTCECLAKGKPVYMFHDPSADLYGYVYTSSETKRKQYLEQGYVEDGVAWYGC
ncbi:MAG TPA: hypothetical protein DHW39_02475 [Erysipelotrichaceae bacterium]|nr:hypothetical protein [Erysipelotrichaceae bacterium]